MKKLVFIFSFMFFLYPAFSQNNNLIFSQSFPVNDVENFDILLTYEEFFLESYINDEILIEIYSNNNRFLPDIDLSDSTLSIKSNGYKRFFKGTKILIKMYIPKYESFSKFDITSNTCSPIIKDFSVNQLNVTTKTGNLTLESVNSDFFSLETITGNIKAENISCPCFNLSAKTGNIFFDYNSEITAMSKIQTTTGIIELYLNEQNDFDIVFSSQTGTFTNKWDFSEYKSREFIDIPINKGGPELYLQTQTGNIILYERDLL